MDECRKQFEEWITYNGQWPSAADKRGDTYLLQYTESAWIAWQVAWNRRAAQVPEVALYHELLFAVASKFPNESRHQTALRYINSAEHGQTKVGTMLAPEVKHAE